MCWRCRSEDWGEGKGVEFVGLSIEGKGNVLEVSVCGVRGRERCWKYRSEE